MKMVKMVMLMLLQEKTELCGRGELEEMALLAVAFGERRVDRTADVAAVVATRGGGGRSGRGGSRGSRGLAAQLTPDDLNACLQLVEGTAAVTVHHDLAEHSLQFGHGGARIGLPAFAAPTSSSCSRAYHSGEETTNTTGSTSTRRTLFGQTALQCALGLVHCATHRPAHLPALQGSRIVDCARRTPKQTSVLSSLCSLLLLLLFGLRRCRYGLLLLVRLL